MRLMLLGQVQDELPKVSGLWDGFPAWPPVGTDQQELSGVEGILDGLSHGQTIELLPVPAQGAVGESCQAGGLETSSQSHGGSPGSSQPGKR